MAVDSTLKCNCVCVSSIGDGKVRVWCHWFYCIGERATGGDRVRAAIQEREWSETESRPPESVVIQRVQVTDGSLPSVPQNISECLTCLFLCQRSGPDVSPKATGEKRQRWSSTETTLEPCCHEQQVMSGSWNNMDTHTCTVCVHIMFPSAKIHLDF